MRARQMPDQSLEDAGADLAEKQAAEVEESIAAQRRIAEELQEQGEDTTAAKGFLEVLLACRNFRRARARSHLPSRHAKPGTGDD